MSGYFGTEIQQRLQRETDELHAMIDATPGLFHAGRMFGCDDPDRVGWDFICEHLESDGVFGFRMIPVEKAADIGERLASQGYRWDTWDVFTADGKQALAASLPIIESGLPDGLAEVSLPTDPEDAILRQIQQCMADCGVAAFSGSMLLGRFAPACTVAVAPIDRWDCRDRPQLYAVQLPQQVSSRGMGRAGCRLSRTTRTRARRLCQRARRCRRLS